MELTGGALARLNDIVPDGMDFQIDLTITDEPPIAEALVIITAIPRSGS
jgi:holo-[acyl-carrier protein] synthase